MAAGFPSVVTCLLCGITKAVPGTLQEGGAPLEMTPWTVVLQAGQADADELARKGLATFSETFWPQLCPFARQSQYPSKSARWGLAVPPNVICVRWSRTSRANSLSRGRFVRQSFAHFGNRKPLQ